MSTWATKRKYSIIIIILLLITIPIVVVVYMSLKKEPSCFDKKQNQSERGVDCGGPCSLVCAKDSTDVIVSWERLLKVDKGIYTAVAYIENPNLMAGAKNVPYIFKIYNGDGVLIDERIGKTDLSPKNVFAIVEPGILTGEETPKRMTFEFTAVPVWNYAKEVSLPLSVTSKELTREDVNPRIEAVIKNTSVKAIRNVTVVALVYGVDGNALGASKTIIEKVEGENFANTIFTWPHPFDKKVSRIEIVPSL